MMALFNSQFGSQFAVGVRSVNSSLARENPKDSASQFTICETGKRRRKSAIFWPFKGVETPVHAHIGQKLPIPPGTAENPTFPRLSARPNPPKSPHVPDQHYCRVTLSAKDTAAHAALRDQVAALIPPDARITGAGWRPWASASFAGARHWFDGKGLAPDSAALAERNWPLEDAFVADAALHDEEPAPGAWRIELLVVDN